MTTHHVVILGAGAAATAAARALASQPGIETTIVGQTGETPYSRMLIKGVACGLTPPEFVRITIPSAEFIADTAVGVDVVASRVHLASGEVLAFDSLIVATGSQARQLDADIPGAEQAIAAETLTTLHTLDDAVRIGDAVRASGRPLRVAIYGAGLTASEIASTLQAQGHNISLIARSMTPGIASFGGPVAERIAAEHRSRVNTYFGRTITAIHSETDATVITLDDATDVAVDLVILALGTTPHGPGQWHDGVHVDDRLRVLGTERVYAAGGVTEHNDDHLGTWRIDHWEDSAAQGAHAAQVLLHALGRNDDPGPYKPRSAYMAMIYGHIIAGVGYTAPRNVRNDEGDELVVLHEHAELTVGASGIDAFGTIARWASQLHQVRV